MPNIDLASLFKSDPVAQELGLQFLGQERQKNTQDMELARLREMMNQRKGEEDILNSQAQRPGLTAQSTMLGQQAELGGHKLPGQKQEFDRNQESAGQKAQLEGLEMAGRAYMQAEPFIATLPPPARHAAARQMLGRFYRPEFDQVPPEQLGRVLNFIGSEQQRSQQKAMLATDVIDKKNESAQQIVEKKLAAQKEIEMFKANIKAQLEKLKAAPLPTREKVLGQLMSAIQEEDDPGKRSALVEQYNEFAKQINDEKVRVAQAGQVNKPDVGAIAGVPTLPQTPAPQLPTAPPTQGNNPVAVDASVDKYKQAFGAYEPDKYIYRIGPNGVPQRKKK